MKEQLKILDSIMPLEIWGFFIGAVLAQLIFICLLIIVNRK